MRRKNKGKNLQAAGDFLSVQQETLDKINLKREINISLGKGDTPYIRRSYSEHETHRLHMRKKN